MKGQTFEGLFCARHGAPWDSGYTGGEGRWGWGVSCLDREEAGTPIFAACFLSVPRAVQHCFSPASGKVSGRRDPAELRLGANCPALSPGAFCTSQSADRGLPSPYAPSRPDSSRAPVLRSGRPSERVLPAPALPAPALCVAKPRIRPPLS